MAILFVLVIYGGLVVTPRVCIVSVGLHRGHPLLATVEGFFATLVNEHVAPRGTDN